jgi:CCR4-NOT transcription complex subunit 7/8
MSSLYAMSICLLNLYFKVVRIGSSHQAGSDSLLTASTFFKMRELYFNDQVDDVEFSGKLYGLGQTFTVSNGLADPGRGGATIAEREDRGSSARETHNQTNSASQTPMGMGPMQSGTLSGAIPSSVSYAPMGTNGAYLRTSLVGGGR